MLQRILYILISDLSELSRKHPQHSYILDTSPLSAHAHVTSHLSHTHHKPQTAGMATLFTPAPPPPTPLGRYRQLSPLAGVHVSPICLGGMSIGDKWGPYGMGAMDKASSFKVLDAYYDAGGNFIDTANGYQDGTSEAFIGEWMEARGVRDQMVIATKVRPLSVVTRSFHGVGD